MQQFCSFRKGLLQGFGCRHAQLRVMRTYCGAFTKMMLEYCSGNEQNDRANGWCARVMLRPAAFEGHSVER